MRQSTVAPGRRRTDKPMTRYLVTESDGHWLRLRLARRGPRERRRRRHDPRDRTTARPRDPSPTPRRSSEPPATARAAATDYDFTLCSPVRTCRWAQMDTQADAPWFGQVGPTHSPAP